MLLALGGSAYFMGIAQNDDVMLSYQDTSFHDDAALRRMLGLRPNRSSSGGWSRSACSRVASRRAGSETRVSSTDDEDFLTALRRDDRTHRHRPCRTALPDARASRFKEDLAIARDAVRREVQEDLVQRLGLLALSSRAEPAPVPHESLARSLPR